MNRVITERDLARIEAGLLKGLAHEAAPHSDYQARPLDWIVERLGVSRETLRWSLNDEYDGHAWDGTKDPLAAILEGLANGEDVGCESGRGVGKTFLAACVVLWFLAAHEDALVITIAPKREQLLKQCWREIQRLFPRFQRHFPSAELTQGALRVRGGTDESWSAHAYGAGVGAEEQLAVRAAGWHAEHMLVLFEETTGVNPAIMATIDMTCTGEHNPRLALGNPVHQGDTLHRFCTRPSVRHVRASAMDHPNVVAGREVVPGAVGRRSIEQRKRDWAHAPAVIEANIHGLSPDQAHGAVFRVPDEAIIDVSDEEVLQGVERGHHVLLGIDYGANTFACVFGVLDAEGRVTIVREYMSHREDMDTRMEQVVAILDELGEPVKIRAWGDSAGPFLIESKASLRRLGRRDVKIDGTRKGKVRGAANTEKGYVAGGIDKVNSALARGDLLIASSLASDWRHGVGGSSPGRPVEGESRLRWELLNLQWDERRPDAPNKDSADGAHMTDALRYLVMGKLERYRARTPEERDRRARRSTRRTHELARHVPMPQTEADFYPQDERNRDRGLERLAAHRWRTTGRYHTHLDKQAREAEAAREARKAREEKERAERDAEHAAEKAKEAALSDFLDPMLDAIDRSGLSMDEAVDRILGVEPGE